MIVAGASHESGVKWTKNVFAYRAVVMYDAGTVICQKLLSLGLLLFQ